MIGVELPKNGPKWHAIRSGKDLFKHIDHNYSESLKRLITKMMDPNPDNRVSADYILSNYLFNDQDLEIKSQKVIIKNLRTKLDNYEKVLNIKRKQSF